MSGGFSFPPPPPPPPKGGFDGTQHQYDSQIRGRGRGPGRSRESNPSFRGAGRGRCSSTASGHRENTYQHQRQAPYPSDPRDHTSVGANGRDTFPSRTVAGHKRKLDALRPPAAERGPKLQTAPAVPIFGAPLLPGPSLKPESKEPHGTKSSKGLGLVPGLTSEDADVSDEGEGGDSVEDEEALHAELGDKLTFEHNGVVMTLSSPADLIAWQEERRKKWPTRGRVAEKEAEKWSVGQERKRLLATAGAVAREAVKARRAEQKPKTRRFPQPAEEPPTEMQPEAVVEPITVKDETPVEAAKRELAEKERSLAALRKKVTKDQAALERALAAHDEELRPMPTAPPVAASADAALDHASIVDDSDASSVLSESSAVSSSTDDDSREGEQDDEPPEEIAVKMPGQTASERPAKLCRYFAASGHCRDGEACRFRHELAPGTKISQRPQKAHIAPSNARSPRLDPTSDERKSIYQRLLEQQQEEEDRLALQVVKYLGRTGFFEEREGDRQG